VRGSEYPRISLWRLLLASALGVAIGTAVYLYATSMQQPGRDAAQRRGQEAVSTTAVSDVPRLAPTTAVRVQVPIRIIATEISPTNIKTGDTIDIKITVENTSDKLLPTMGPEPGFTYVQGQTYFTQQFGSDPGKWRVAIGTAGLDSTELPYRWGLGGDLAPGATTTVTGHIKVTLDFKATNFWAALVTEPSAVVQTGVGMTLVTSLPENLAIVAVDAANVRSRPSNNATPAPR
jgi:hypothetical protein